MDEFVHSFLYLTSFKFTAQDFLSAKTYLGNGNIEVVKEETKINLNGNGSWRDTNLNSSPFYFSYRFSFNTGTIEIEHTRYGETQSVYLSKLNRITPQKFKSATPHICNDDLYNAELLFEKQAMILRWMIKGPQKNMFLEYTFKN